MRVLKSNMGWDRIHGAKRLIRLTMVSMSLVAGAALGAGAERTGSAPDTEEVAVLARPEQQAAPRIVRSKPLLIALRSALPADRDAPTSTPDWSLQVLGRTPEEYRFWSRQQVMLRTGVDGASRTLRIPSIARSLERLGGKPLPLPAVPTPAKVGEDILSCRKVGNPVMSGRSLSERFGDAGMVFVGRVEGVSDFFTEGSTSRLDYTNYIVRIFEEYKSPYPFSRRYARVAWPGTHRPGGRAREYPLLRPGEVYLFFTSRRLREALDHRPMGDDYGDEGVMSKNWEAGLGVGIYRIVDGMMAPPFPELAQYMLEVRAAIGNPRIYPYPGGLGRVQHIWEEPRYGMPWLKFRSELLPMKARDQQRWRVPAGKAPGAAPAP